MSRPKRIDKLKRIDKQDLLEFLRHRIKDYESAHKFNITMSCASLSGRGDFINREFGRYNMLCQIYDELSPEETYNG